MPGGDRERFESRLGWSFRRRAAARPGAGAPVLVRRAPRGRIERTARVPGRCSARDHRHRPRLPDLSVAPGGPSGQGPGLRRQCGRARRGGAPDRARPVPAPRQGRGRVRAGGRRPRSSPTWSRRSSPRSISTAGSSCPGRSS